MGASVLERLGAWVARVALADIPEIALATAKRSILDCIGVAVAAGREPIAEVLDRYLCDVGAGRSSVVGREAPVSSESAALVNGALAHALDFDDVSHTMGGHPTVPTLWSSLAVAEADGHSGAELLRAYCIGVEIETAIARGVNFHHYDHGWHPTATLGTLGATAAVAALYRLPADRIAVALGYATATAAGIKASFGTMAKPLQVGRSAQSGVLNAALARAGATANPEAMEAPQGFANVYDGEGNYDLDAMTRYLGNPWDLVDPGIAIKLHPCCGGTHSAVDAGIELHRQLGSVHEIESVDAYIHQRRYAHLDRPHPTNALDAKFSLQHTVALALSHGVVRIDDFTDDTIRDQELVGLRERVRAHPLPPDREGPEHFAAEVHVRLADGTERVARMERPRGRTPETALTDDDIETKFRACTDSTLDVAQQDQLIAAIGGLENQQHLGPIVSVLRTRSPSPARVPS
jgi:2-methylcitrate dehydratase PrpD